MDRNVIVVRMWREFVPPDQPLVDPRKPAAAREASQRKPGPSAEELERRRQRSMAQNRRDAALRRERHGSTSTLAQFGGRGSPPVYDGRAGRYRIHFGL